MSIFSGASESKSFFDAMQPKHSFWLGLAAGIGIMVLVSFIIVSVMFFKGFTPSKGGSANNGAPTNVAANGAEEQQPAEVNMLPVTKDDWIRGDKDAKIVVVEYSDTECPFCKRHHETLKKLIEDYGGKVAWVYRHFPIPSLHSKAPKEAEALECAGDLGGNEAFWKYTDMVYENTPTNDGLDPAELPKFAEKIGLNKAKFEECLSSGKFTEKVKKMSEDAVSAGARGTPHNVVVFGDQKTPVAGAYPIEQFKSIIDPLLK
jgi:protein-disulfide isomerase